MKVYQNTLFKVQKFVKMMHLALASLLLLFLNLCKNCQDAKSSALSILTSNALTNHEQGRLYKKTLIIAGIMTKTINSLTFQKYLTLNRSNNVSKNIHLTYNLMLKATLSHAILDQTKAILDLGVIPNVDATILKNNFNEQFDSIFDLNVNQNLKKPLSLQKFLKNWHTKINFANSVLRSLKPLQSTPTLKIEQLTAYLYYTECLLIYTEKFYPFNQTLTIVNHCCCHLVAAFWIQYAKQLPFFQSKIFRKAFNIFTKQQINLNNKNVNSFRTSHQRNQALNQIFKRFLSSKEQALFYESKMHNKLLAPIVRRIQNQAPYKKLQIQYPHLSNYEETILKDTRRSAERIKKALIPNSAYLYDHLIETYIVDNTRDLKRSDPSVDEGISYEDLHQTSCA